MVKAVSPSPSEVLAARLEELTGAHVSVSKRDAHHPKTQRKMTQFRLDIGRGGTVTSTQWWDDYNSVPSALRVMCDLAEKGGLQLLVG